MTQALTFVGVGCDVELELEPRFEHRRVHIERAVLEELGHASHREQRRITLVGVRARVRVRVRVRLRLRVRARLRLRRRLRLRLRLRMASLSGWPSRMALQA